MGMLVIDERVTNVEKSLTKFRPDLLPQIKEIISHKGCLEVYWNINNPAPNDRRFLECLWHYEGECNIWHHDPDGRVIEEVLL